MVIEQIFATSFNFKICNFSCLPTLPKGGILIDVHLSDVAHYVFSVYRLPQSAVRISKTAYFIFKLA